MKKLYNHTKGKIHPSPPPPLSLLPLAIATLAAALSPEDQEILAYLLSNSGTTTTTKSTGSHPAQFTCKCFECYKYFWARWNTSPNKEAIHEIIDAYEDGLTRAKKGNRTKKERKPMKVLASSGLKVSHTPGGDIELKAREDHAQSQSEEEVAAEKGSVRKIVGFIGERIWGVWGI